MRTIICDDETSVCAEMEQMLKHFASEKEIRLDLEVFYDGNELAQYLKKEDAPDILFLDIQLPGMNGVDIGKYIRETLQNTDMLLIYISSREEYAMDLFQNQPFDFMIKPITEEKLCHVMEKILQRVTTASRSFLYKIQGNSYQIMYKDILYFQSDGRKIDIVTKNKTESFYGQLSEIEKVCPENLFLRIHKSYLVNIHHMKEITYQWVKMINDDVLVISKANRSEIRRQIMESIADGMRYGG